MTTSTPSGEADEAQGFFVSLGVCAATKVEAKEMAQQYFAKVGVTQVIFDDIDPLGAHEVSSDARVQELGGRAYFGDAPEQ